MKPSPYADILLAHQQVQPKPQKPGKPTDSARSPYAGVLLSHVQEAPAGDTGYKGLTRAEIETRWRGALPSDPAKVWNMSRRESERYHMALVDVMMVGVPTFGESNLVYPGRDEIKKAIKAGRPAELAAYEYLESNFGPITAAKRRAAAEAMNALRSNVTKPVGEFLSGQVFAEAFPFRALLQDGNAPKALRGAAKAIGNVVTGEGFANWEKQIEEIEGIAKETAFTRAGDGVAQFLLYFIPGIGQAAAAGDTLDVLGKSETMGLAPAMADELKETLKGINFAEPGLTWDERVVRGLGAFLGVVGLAHGIKTARDVYVDVRAGWKTDPMGALVGDAFEEAMKGDRWTNLFTEPERGVPALGAMKARGELQEKFAKAAGEVPRLMDARITQMASDGDPEAKEALARSEKNGTRPTEELMAVKAESDSPFRAGEDAIWNVGDSFEPVRLTALAGEKGGERFWYVEGSNTAVPESSLRPEAVPIVGSAARVPKPRQPREVAGTKEAETALVAEGIIKPIAEDAIELAARRATKLEGESLPEAPKARQVRNQRDFEDVLKINFHMDSREAAQMARLYGARAYAWSERTGRTEAEWWQTRLAGIADRDTVITMRDLGYDVNFRLDEDGSAETGRLIALSADSDVATIQRENGEIIALPRSAIGNEIPARIERALMSDSGEPRGVDAFDVVGKPKRDGSTYVEVPYLKGERIKAELTGEPRKRYLSEQRRYEEEARKLDRENAPDQAKREAFARYRANVREIIGRPTPEEAYKKANERDYFKPGMRLDTALHGRVEVINMSSGAVRARTADGKIKMIPQHILMAEGMTREMSKPKDGVTIIPKLEDYEGGWDAPGLGLANVGPRVRGLVQFLEDGRAILRAFQGNDIRTFAHEFGHILRREFYRGDEFTPEEVAAVERWAGVEDGNWTREAEEKFAEGFEKYLTLGKSPTRGLKSLFERFKNKATALYQSITSGPATIEIPDEIAAVFDKALGKDIDKRDAKKEKAERVAEKEAEAFEAMKIDEEVELVDYLKTIEGDDPRIDPFSDEFDPDLVDMVKAKLGGGAEDPRTPYEIVLAYQEAEYKQQAVAEAMSDYLADSPWIDEVSDTLNEGSSGPTFHRVYNAKAGQRGNVSQIGKNIDQRTVVKSVGIGDWSPELRQAFDDWIATSYQSEGDYLLVRADLVKDLKKSGEWRGNLFLPSEIVSRENGKLSVAPVDMVQEFLSHLRGDSKRQETNLYQGAEEPGPKGWSDVIFERHADTLAAFAEENLARFGGNHAEVRKLIERTTDGLSTRQVSEIMNRMWERTAFGRIQETYEQYGLSLQAQRKMLSEEFPDLEKNRQPLAVRKALKEIGVELATKPDIKVEKGTKRKIPTGKESIVIGAGDVLIPREVFTLVNEKLPKAASLWSPKRVIEHVAGRTGAMVDFLVRNREEAVASLQDHLAHYRSELELRYGDKAKDRDFRMFVMMAAEGKDHRVKLEEFDPAVGYPEYTVEKLKAERPNDWQQILDVAEWHRGEYDKLLDVVNNVRTRFNLGEIPKRQDYFSHMADERGVFEKVMGIEDVHEPGAGNPNAKRNSNYNQFAQMRTGERTRVDSLANFEEYLEVVLRQIHLTEPAVRHRAVARAITQKDIEGVNKDVAAYLDALANELAAQSQIPGARIGAILLNSKYGAQVEAAMRFVIARIASNTLVGNLQTALMQTAQLPIAVPIVGAKNLLTSAQTRLMVALHKLPDPSEDSSFLRRRYAYQGRISSPRPILSRGFWNSVERRALKNDSGTLGRTMQKVGDTTEAAKRVAAIPMEFVEEAIVRTIWNAAHIQSKQHGRTHEESVRYADEVTERLIGGRAIGEKPPAFNNLLASIPLQFQLEVGNFIQFLKHDLNRDIYTGDRVPQKEYIRRVAVGMVSIYVANSVYEQMFGSRPLPDPVETVIDWAGIVGHQELSPGEKVTRVAGRGLGEFISAYPGSGFFTGLILPEKGKLIGVGLTKRELFGNSNVGEFTGGSPVTTQLRRITESRDTVAGDAAEAISIIGLPFGGSQIRKSITGLKAAVDGEVTDKQGKTRFEVEGFQKLISILFGPYATPAGQEWLDTVKDKNN